MFALRAVSVYSPPLIRYASTRNTQTTKSILRDIENGVSSLNPFTQPRITTDDPFAGPPRAGPEGYTSSKYNPMSRANIGQTLKNKYSGKHYRFDCFSTRNNTIITLSSLDYFPDESYKPPISKPIAWYSGGSVGFKKSARGGYEAGYQCVVRAFKLLEQLSADSGNQMNVHLYFRGFGQGREALKTALRTSEGDRIRESIKTITDRTALKIGGTRSKKTRRL